MRGMSSDMMSPDADQEATQIVGRQIWRVVPYASDTWPSCHEILSNMAARMFDLLPFVAMGYAVDYFTNDIMSGPQFIQDFVEFLPGSTAVGYGTLDFPRFLFPSIFPRAIRIFLANFGLQNSARFTHGRNKVVDIDGVIVLRYEANRTDNVGFV